MDQDWINDSDEQYCGKMISYCFPSGYCIQMILLGPSCIIALILGVILGISIKRMKNTYPSKFFYSLAFFTFGIMMTSAMILHLFLHDSTGGPTWVKITRLIFTILDYSLTSSIAITFAFAGLADLNLWSWKNTICKTISILCWVGIFVGWTVCMFQGFNVNIYSFLYVKLIGCSGILWFITQIIIFLFSGNPLTKKEWTFIFLAMFFASTGLIVIVGPVGRAYCKLVGLEISAILSPMVIWFYFSDFSILFLGLFILATRKTRETAIKYYIER